MGVPTWTLHNALPAEGPGDVVAFEFKLHPDLPGELDSACRFKTRSWIVRSW